MADKEFNFSLSSFTTKNDLNTKGFRFTNIDGQLTNINEQDLMSIIGNFPREIGMRLREENELLYRVVKRKNKEGEKYIFHIIYKIEKPNKEEFGRVNYSGASFYFRYDEILPSVKIVEDALRYLLSNLFEDAKKVIENSEKIKVTEIQFLEGEEAKKQCLLLPIENTSGNTLHSFLDIATTNHDFADYSFIINPIIESAYPIVRYFNNINNPAYNKELKIYNKEKSGYSYPQKRQNLIKNKEQRTKNEKKAVQVVSTFPIEKIEKQFKSFNRKIVETNETLEFIEKKQYSFFKWGIILFILGSAISIGLFLFLFQKNYDLDQEIEKNKSAFEEYKKITTDELDKLRNTLINDSLLNIVENKLNTKEGQKQDSKTTQSVNSLKTDKPKRTNTKSTVSSKKSKPNKKTESKNNLGQNAKNAKVALENQGVEAVKEADTSKIKQNTENQTKKDNDSKKQILRDSSSNDTLKKNN